MVGEGVGFGIQVSFVAILITAAPSIIIKPWLGHVASFHRERMQWELGCLCAKSLKKMVAFQFLLDIQDTFFLEIITASPILCYFQLDK